MDIVTHGLEFAGVPDAMRLWREVLWNGDDRPTRESPSLPCSSTF